MHGTIGEPCCVVSLRIPTDAPKPGTSYEYQWHRVTQEQYQKMIVQQGFGHLFPEDVPLRNCVLGGIEFRVVQSWSDIEPWNTKLQDEYGAFLQEGSKTPHAA